MVQASRGLALGIMVGALLSARQRRMG